MELKEKIEIALWEQSWEGAIHGNIPAFHKQDHDTQMFYSHQAEAILPVIEEQVKAEKQQSFQDGYDTGLKEGLRAMDNGR